MQKQDKISIIVPCHNEEEVLPLFLKEIEKIYEVMHVKHNVEMEYLFVDDGSTDRTLMFLREQEAENPRVNYLSFSRNFGKEAAMFAGLEKASGDYVVIIDADLQDPPELILQFIQKWEEGYDMVYGIRNDRRSDSWLKRWTAKLFYKAYNLMTRSPNQYNAEDYRQNDRKINDAILV